MPTLLLGDLNFPDEVHGSSVLSAQRRPSHPCFAKQGFMSTSCPCRIPPTSARPGPTKMSSSIQRSEGSWLPKRIDTIVLLSPSTRLKARCTGCPAGCCFFCRLKQNEATACQVRVLAAEEVLAELGEATQMLFPTR